MQNLIGLPNLTHTLQVTGCHIGRYPPGWEYPRHHHHLFELLCCLEGEVVQEINRKSVTLRPGDWLLINAGVRHKTANKSLMDYEFFNVHFDLDDLDIRRLLGLTPYRLISAGDAARSGVLNRYVEELQAVMKQSPGDESDTGAGLENKLLLQANIMLIVREMLLLIRGQQAESTDAVSVTLFAADAAHLIEEKLSLGLSEDISIASVAKELNMSRSQCTKLFTKVYGLSPKQYVSRKKLAMAKELLVSSYLPVSEIAERLGFQSASHFSRQFRRWTGQSPTAFKPKHRGNVPGAGESPSAD
ncbi:AraC-type DNA-binding protein [Paenibacillus sp. UNCCL117]|uniref:AraC family transcriptional regulator n=1 Tax=unclassified Paenibacillus TaxID=185978 RepID=UPI00088D32EE|nr:MULTISPECIES: AraC family transcriptional regulator [unclassified Paenibacillus]SDC25354.1 AraC-type DNA-binding protein [Paenibacillus sp. cl123]SFW19808.1 AraC-type DNA-binding protein [Paenibacillus sp. UNCCL117]